MNQQENTLTALELPGTARITRRPSSMVARWTQDGVEFDLTLSGTGAELTASMVDDPAPWPTCTRLQPLYIDRAPVSELVQRINEHCAVCIIG